MRGTPARLGRALASTTADGAVVAAVAAFFLLRPSLGPVRVFPLALCFAGMAAASLARGTGSRPTGVVALPFLVGAVAVVAARFMSGSAAPVRAGALAVALNIGAAVAEEAFFRGFLFVRLERWGIGVAVAASALAFALVHVPLYGTAAFPVDLGAGLLLSWQRWATGRWSVPAATHALANLLVVMP
jgi:membrane protease YdiL (CAAX protease family)